jgi:hypothetical protein
MRDEKKIVMAQKLFLKMKGLATMKKMSAQIIEDLENENEELKERVKKMEWHDKDISNKPIPSWKNVLGSFDFWVSGADHGYQDSALVEEGE